MIDLCCHILPGLDGGAPYLEASVRMGEIAVDSGCNVLVTAPISADSSDSMYRVCDSKKLSDAYLGLTEQIHARRIPLQLISGMLIHASDPLKVVTGLEEGYLYPIAGTDYLLLDVTGYQQADLNQERDRLLDMTMCLRRAGFIPVYTRPEYIEVFIQDPDFCADVLQDGGFFLGSKPGLLGRLGTASQDALMYMISQGYISAIASFAVHHEFDTPHMRETADILTGEFSQETASLLLDINPDRILNNEVLYTN